jgi:hypothetical protein
MMNPAIMLLAILLLAALTEALVEYFIAPLIKPDTMKDAPVWRSMVLRYSAAAVGVALCLVYAVDLLGMIGLSGRVPFVGEVATGLLIGRGSNFVNDFIERWVRPTLKAP